MQQTKSEVVETFLSEFKGYLKKNPYVLQEAILRHKGINVNTNTCRKVQRKLRKSKKEVITSFSKPFKRLFFDIETSPNIGFFWQCGYKLNIGHHNIIQERAIICVSYKWEHENTVYNLRWENGDDKQLIIEFAKILESASEVIAHNGDKFDIPWLRGRALYHNVPFPTYIKSLDTYLKSRSQFRLNSNKLDYLAKYLNVGGKIEDGGFDNWKQIVLHNDPEALNTMIQYCNNDVVILEDVFHKIKNYIKLNTHEGVYKGNAKWSCPSCGSKNVSLYQNHITSAGTLQRVMKCNDCNTTYKISNTEYLDFLLHDNK